MKNLLTLITLFVFVGIILYSAIISLGQVYTANLGDCAYNSTGSLVNCSLSNAQYLQQKANADTSQYYFSTLSLILWLLIIAVFVAAGYVLLKSGK